MASLWTDVIGAVAPTTPELDRAYTTPTEPLPWIETITEPGGGGGLVVPIPEPMPPVPMPPPATAGVSVSPLAIGAALLIAWLILRR